MLFQALSQVLGTPTSQTLAWMWLPPGLEPSEKGQCSRTLPRTSGSLKLFLWVLAGDLSTATKSKTSEDISKPRSTVQSTPPDPYYATESEYWTYHGSPKGTTLHKGARTRALSPTPGTQRARTDSRHSFTHNAFTQQTCTEGSYEPSGDTGKQPRAGPCPCRCCIAPAGEDGEVASR